MIVVPIPATPDRDTALDLHIEAGRALGEFGPLSFLATIAADGAPCCQSAVPTAVLVALLRALRVASAETQDLHEVNGSLRRQRDDAESKYRALRFLRQR